MAEHTKKKMKIDESAKDALSVALDPARPSSKHSSGGSVEGLRKRPKVGVETADLHAVSSDESNGSGVAKSKKAKGSTKKRTKKKKVVPKKMDKIVEEVKRFIPDLQKLANQVKNPSVDDAMTSCNAHFKQLGDQVVQVTALGFSGQGKSFTMKLLLNPDLDPEKGPLPSGGGGSGVTVRMTSFEFNHYNPEYYELFFKLISELTPDEQKSLEALEYRVHKSAMSLEDHMQALCHCIKNLEAKLKGTSLGEKISCFQIFGPFPHLKKLNMRLIDTPGYNEVGKFPKIKSAFQQTVRMSDCLILQGIRNSAMEKLKWLVDWDLLCQEFAPVIVTAIRNNESDLETEEQERFIEEIRQEIDKRERPGSSFKAIHYRNFRSDLKAGVLLFAPCHRDDRAKYVKEFCNQLHADSNRRRLSKIVEAAAVVVNIIRALASPAASWPIVRKILKQAGAVHEKKYWVKGEETRILRKELLEKLLPLVDNSIHVDPDSEQPSVDVRGLKFNFANLLKNPCTIEFMIRFLKSDNEKTVEKIQMLFAKHEERSDLDVEPLLEKLTQDNKKWRADLQGKLARGFLTKVKLGRTAEILNELVMSGSSSRRQHTTLEGPSDYDSIPQGMLPALEKALTEFIVDPIIDSLGAYLRMMMANFTKETENIIKESKAREYRPIKEQADAYFQISRELEGQFIHYEKTKPKERAVKVPEPMPADEFTREIQGKITTHGFPSLEGQCAPKKLVTSVHLSVTHTESPSREIALTLKHPTTKAIVPKSVDHMIREHQSKTKDLERQQRDNPVLFPTVRLVIDSDGFRKTKHKDLLVDKLGGKNCTDSKAHRDIPHLEIICVAQDNLEEIKSQVGPECTQSVFLVFPEETQNTAVMLEVFKALMHYYKFAYWWVVPPVFNKFCRYDRMIVSTKVCKTWVGLYHPQQQIAELEHRTKMKVHELAKGKRFTESITAALTDADKKCDWGQQDAQDGVAFTIRSFARIIEQGTDYSLEEGLDFVLNLPDAAKHIQEILLKFLSPVVAPWIAVGGITITRQQAMKSMHLCRQGIAYFEFPVQGCQQCPFLLVNAFSLRSFSFLNENETVDLYKTIFPQGGSPEVTSKSKTTLQRFFSHRVVPNKKLRRVFPKDIMVGW